MLFNQIVKILITKEEVIEAIKKAKEQNFIDNLRYRHPNVSFDSKLRGYIGEIGLKKWFIENNIDIVVQNYIDDGLSIDIDFQYKNLDIELKTSLIPDIDGDLETAFNKRDIKLINRGGTIEDLKGDIHIQIFYQHQTKKKDLWLKDQVIDLSSDDTEYLYNAFLGRGYLERTFLFCWIDRPTIIKRIKALPEHRRTWGFAQRRFWVCPLRNSFPPSELITYLNDYE